MMSIFQFLGIFIPVFIMLTIYLWLCSLPSSKLKESVETIELVVFGLCLLVLGFTLGTIVPIN